ncbi:MAG: GFA family protein [Pseudomonadota bacterium]
MLEGHCLCGACRFVLEGPHNWIGHCHCESCRRATASPMTTWIGQQNGTWRWTGADPAIYSSSPGVTRGFCATCGTPLFFHSDRWPDETHFYAALLTDPTLVTPQTHYHLDEKLSWLHVDPQK